MNAQHQLSLRYAFGNMSGQIFAPQDHGPQKAYLLSCMAKTLTAACPPRFLFF
jgi:hypothetical protein